VRTQFVRANRCRVLIAVSNARQWRKRRTSTVIVDILDVKARSITWLHQRLKFDLEFGKGEIEMNNLKLYAAMLTLLGFATLAGCFGTSTKSPAVSENIRQSLDRAGFKEVSVTQDRARAL
jgi:hypothetical protein